MGYFERAEISLADKPKFLTPSSVCYETIMGSRAYSVEKPDSDWDIYGFVLPPKGLVFPHTEGWIQGFDKQIPCFNQWQGLAPVVRKDGSKIEADFSLYSIVQYFKLVAENNPNMLDSLFTPDSCVLTCNEIGKLVRSKRDLFVSKKCYHTYSGYAYSQLSKMRTKNPEGKRAAEVAECGWDRKFGYHLIRLIDQCQQLLETGSMDLSLNKEKLKAIRNGEWTMEDVEQYFSQKASIIEDLYNRSTIPHFPQNEKIKQLLLECLEISFGSIDNMLKTDDSPAKDKLRRIQEVLDS